MRRLIVAAALAAGFALASTPALANVEFEIFGEGSVTASYLENNCWGSFCSDTPLGLAVGTPVQLSIWADLDLPLGFTGYANHGAITVTGLGNFGGATYGSFHFVNGKLDQAYVFTDLNDDVCGGGRQVIISGGSFDFQSSRCGYAQGLPYPYPFINVDGAGHLTGTFVDGIAVPEPATWAMMLGGFGLAGAALRRRRRVIELHN
jgi:hypothetical protein